MLHRIGVVFLLSLCITYGAKEDKPQILLCIDGSKSVDLKDVLVYTYLDGKKTECMPRDQLTALIDRNREPRSGCDQGMAEKVKAVDSCKAAYRELAAPAGKDLRTRDFKDARLANADFSGANLESADFRGADLQNANFTNANLRAAYFKGADLRGADFTGADMFGVYLNNADLRGIRGFSIDQVRIVNTLFEATLDTVFHEEIEYCCKDKLAKASWYWHNNTWADDRAKKRNQQAERRASAQARASARE